MSLPVTPSYVAISDHTYQHMLTMMTYMCSRYAKLIPLFSYFYPYTPHYFTLLHTNTDHQYLYNTAVKNLVIRLKTILSSVSQMKVAFLL